MRVGGGIPELRRRCCLLRPDGPVSAGAGEETGRLQKKCGWTLDVFSQDLNLCSFVFTRFESLRMFFFSQDSKRHVLPYSLKKKSKIALEHG